MRRCIWVSRGHYYDPRIIRQTLEVSSWLTLVSSDFPSWVGTRCTDTVGHELGKALFVESLSERIYGWCVNCLVRQTIPYIDDPT